MPRCRREGGSGVCSRGALHQLLEARELAQWIERGIDAEPAGRQIVGNPEQRLDLVEGFVWLTHQDVDPGELVLDVRGLESVLRDRAQLDAALALANGVLLPPQV